jgi:hypothetical protein
MHSVFRELDAQVENSTLEFLSDPASGVQFSAPRKNDGSFNEVGQLPNVAFPWIARQAHRFGSRRRYFASDPSG